MADPNAINADSLRSLDFRFDKFARVRVRKFLLLCKERSVTPLLSGTLFPPSSRINRGNEDVTTRRRQGERGYCQEE